MGKSAEVNRLQGLRVAVLAPITWPTPPPGYGPWEQIAFNIADGMRRRGLDVTLFAPGNSGFDSRVESVVPVGCAEDPALNADVFSALHIGHLMESAHDYDLIHNNFDWKPMTYALAAKAPPMLTTVHGFSSPQILAAYYACAWRSFYCIHQRCRSRSGPFLSGHDVQRHRSARNSRSMRIRASISSFWDASIRRRVPIWRSRLPSAPVSSSRSQRFRKTKTYFAKYVQPHIDGEQIQFLGEVRRRERNELLGNALALVHMTTRPERFGLTMIEAMACGTPVLGANMGSVPEIVIDGETGFLCDSVEDAAAKVPLLASLDRRACRARVQSEFTVDRMIDRYLDAYTLAVEQQLPPPAAPEQLRWRAHDWWDRPMAYTEIPPKPASTKIFVTPRFRFSRFTGEHTGIS